MTDFWDGIAVAVIVAFAAGYLVRRLFLRSGCGPCQGAGCDPADSDGLVQLQPPSPPDQPHGVRPAGRQNL